MAIVLAREDVEVHLRAPQTTSEHLWLCVWATSDLEQLQNFRKHLDPGMRPVT